MQRIALTTGDEDGIGLEVTAKALARSRSHNFILWRSPQADRRWLKLIDKKYKRIEVSSLGAALATPTKSGCLLDIVSKNTPGHWIEEAAQAAMAGQIAGLVTAPVSKTRIQDAGFTDIGHTDILKRVSGKKDLFMAFIGKNFNVALVTGHLPLEKVSSHLSDELILNLLSLLDSLCLQLKLKKPFALLGLNPHAGEMGLIGKQELSLHQPILKKWAGKNKIIGPLGPDIAFFRENWKKYSFFVAMYHDQGLIPFKMIHGYTGGAHLTLGLPFVRTSVDHGTAKDIFGKNKADPRSMIEALQLCIKLVERKNS